VALLIIYVIGRLVFGFFFAESLLDKVVLVSLGTAFETLSISLVLYFGFFEGSDAESVEWHFLILALVAAATQIVILFALDRASTNYTHTLSGASDRRAQININEIARTQTQFDATVTGARLDYLKRIKAMGFPAILTPQHLAAGGGLAGTRARLVQARALIKKDAAIDHGANATYRQQIMTSRMEAGMKNEQLSLFANRQDDFDNLRQRWWMLNDGIFAEYQAELAELARRREYWMPHGTGVLFADKADLAVFNRHIGTINRLTTEEHQVALEIPASIREAPARVEGSGDFVPPQRLQ
jgi:hypothetical protein